MSFEKKGIKKGCPLGCIAELGFRKNKGSLGIAFPNSLA
jgi:hypothetical protein